ncbi:hypothetical protein ABZO31_33540 [Streptomyces sp. HUAS MG47]|uniref:hypothetical protein n=1 Tax=Streptomyces solicamelliae TaxID=3231716 RepID=UPI003877F88D
MDLRARFAGVALSRPAVLLVAAPGATRERLAVEAELVRRGWPRAAGPAAADLVVFAGRPLPLAGDDWAERVWGGVPAPRARTAVTDAGHAAHALDGAHAALLRGGEGAAQHDSTHESHSHGSLPGGMEHGSSPGGMDHGHGHDRGHGRDHGHGQGHNHGHHIGSVAGFPMAERADDRDGLRLDRLHVPFGPVLPDWPAGLVLRTELQGDVVRRAAVETVPAPPGSRPAFWSEPWVGAAAGQAVTVGEAARRRCAAHLDSVGRFLAVAGWPAPAAEVRRARDRALDGAPVAELRTLLRRPVRQVRRSWTLRWLMAGVGVLTVEQADRHGVGGPARLAGGDAYSRLLVWLDEIERALDACDDPGPLLSATLDGPRGRVDPDRPASAGLLDVLPGLLEGVELACARLIVASLDPDLDEPVSRPAVRGGHAHG